MRILVTGGAGFIGSHVTDHFLAAGHEVAVLDNFVTGLRENVHPGAFLYDVDVRDYEGVARVFADFRPDIVDHHAAQSEVPRSTSDPLFDADVNIMGGLSILRNAHEHGVRKVIFSSTGGALYGNPEVIPCSEDHSIRPMSPYGTSKYCFEQYLATYRRTFGLDYTILRYANVYGPRQSAQTDEGRVVPVFATRMLSGRTVTIDGDGEQSRDMLFVSEAALANIAALNRGSGEAYNIATGIPTTMNTIFGILSDLTDYKLEARHGPARRGDVYKIALATKKAARELDWRAQVQLRDGLSKTIQYVRMRLDGGSVSHV